MTRETDTNAAVAHIKCCKAVGIPDSEIAADLDLPERRVAYLRRRAGIASSHPSARPGVQHDRHPGYRMSEAEIADLYAGREYDDVPAAQAGPGRQRAERA
jgi:hypothetical protein